MTKTAPRLVLLVLMLLYLPWLLVAYVAFAIVDLGRMRSLDWNKIRDYLVSKDGPTWEMAPLNILADLATGGRPKSIRFDDLPDQCRNEIAEVIGAIDHQALLDQIGPKIGNKPKAMIFFKWYGRNIDNFLNLPFFHRRFHYIKTIGLSVFNRRTSTKRHFGPLRLTHRVLFNLNAHPDSGIFLEIDGDKHFWHDDPLVIFDDTYIHDSVNESDGVRYLMFIDIIRASRFRWVHKALEFGVWCVNRVVFPLHRRFYTQWSFVD